MALLKRKAALTLSDAQYRASRILPKALFSYIEGGAEDEVTLNENVSAFRSLRLRPRMGVDVEPNLTTTVLGSRVKMPLLLAPAGMEQIVHPDGAVGVARAAAAAGTIAILSRTALCPLEEVARQAPGPHWFQISSSGGSCVVQDLMERAANAGFTGLVVTLDGPPSGLREADLRNGVVPPVRFTSGLVTNLAAQALARPRWTFRMLAAARKQKAAISGTMRTLSSNAMSRSARFTWDDIEDMRRKWPGSLLVKGVLTGSDALAARNAGADAIIVSNHGGRALDGAPATIEVLPEIVAAVGNSFEVYLDGGIRRASSVAKALCLGARAVFIGRPFLYGLACSGQPGVEWVLDLFRDELVRTMKLLGCPDVAVLNADWLQPTNDWPISACDFRTTMSERIGHAAIDSYTSK